MNNNINNDTINNTDDDDYIVCADIFINDTEDSNTNSKLYIDTDTY